ncbi:hypothetical protein G7046_g5849 [Stylonectria norvegica]|nr:hypothetical protein G7046_g5849 [Stylonectria norvegica]
MTRARIYTKYDAKKAYKASNWRAHSLKCHFPGQSVNVSRLSSNNAPFLVGFSSGGPELHEDRRFKSRNPRLAATGSRVVWGLQPLLQGYEAMASNGNGITKVTHVNINQRIKTNGWESGPDQLQADFCCRCPWTTTTSTRAQDKWTAGAGGWPSSKFPPRGTEMTAKINGTTNMYSTTMLPQVVGSQTCRLQGDFNKCMRPRLNLAPDDGWRPESIPRGTRAGEVIRWWASFVLSYFTVLLRGTKRLLNEHNLQGSLSPLWEERALALQPQMTGYSDFAGPSWSHGQGEIEADQGLGVGGEGNQHPSDTPLSRAGDHSISINRYIYSADDPINAKLQNELRSPLTAFYRGQANAPKFILVQAPCNKNEESPDSPTVAQSALLVGVGTRFNGGGVL